MKFGKQFRLLTAHLSYASSFVDYKALKQIFTNEKNSKKPEDLQKRFEMAIKAEVAKVSIMYKRTLKLAKSKWEKINLDRTTEDGVQVEDDETLGSARSNKSEEPLEAPRPKITAQASIGAGNPLFAEAKELVAQGGSDEAPPDRTEVLLHTLYGLRSFLSLNIEALRKIHKKADKKLGTNLSETQLPGYVELLTKYSEGLLELLSQVKSYLFEEENIDDDDDEAKENGAAIPDEVLYDQPVVTVTELDIASLPEGEITNLRLAISHDQMGEPIAIPIIIFKGAQEGPIVGISCALHGNELNGIPVIHRFVRELDPEEMSGTLVAIPCMNPPGYLRNQRGFHDGQDLNRLFPGKPNGNSGSTYVYHLLHKLIRKMDYLLDLHTASFGRVNSLYVRADMNDEMTRNMALLLKPQIIVHNTAPDGSLRSAAMDYGIPSVTLEIGNPQVITKGFVNAAYEGVGNVLSFLNMTRTMPMPHSINPVLCARSYWLYADESGILEVLFPVNTWVTKGQVFARLTSLYGKLVKKYKAPEDGVIVGKNVNPACGVGDRLIHFGIVSNTFASVADDGHT